MAQKPTTKLHGIPKYNHLISIHPLSSSPSFSGIGPFGLPCLPQPSVRGAPQSSGLPIKLRGLKPWNWVPDGIFPDKLLYDKFKWPKNEMVAIPGGRTPESLFMERSSDSSDFMSPIFAGIFPCRWLLDRFKDIKPWRHVSSSGIPPE